MGSNYTKQTGSPLRKRKQLTSLQHQASVLSSPAATAQAMDNRPALRILLLLFLLQVQDSVQHMLFFPSYACVHVRVCVGPQLIRNKVYGLSRKLFFPIELCMFISNTSFYWRISISYPSITYDLTFLSSCSIPHFKKGCNDSL